MIEGAQVQATGEVLLPSPDNQAKESAVPSTDILQDSITLEDEGTPDLPKGGGDTSVTTPLGGVGDDGRRKRVISSARLLELTKGTLNDPMSQLWGYNVRPKT